MFRKKNVIGSICLISGIAELILVVGKKFGVLKISDFGLKISCIISGCLALGSLIALTAMYINRKKHKYPETVSLSNQAEEAAGKKLYETENYQMLNNTAESENSVYGIVAGREYNVSWITSKGGRAINEDSIRVAKSENVLGCILSDGLGGQGQGDKASSVASDYGLIRIMRKMPYSREQLSDLFENMNQKVLESRDFGSRMMTTSVVLRADNCGLIWGHVGDSRLYYFKKNKIKQITKDHSVSRMAVDMGKIKFDQIRFHPDRNQLLKALGSEGLMNADISKKIPFPNKDISFLLCSDGFWEYVTEKEMEDTLAKSSNSDEWLKSMKEILEAKVECCNDNFSAIAINFKALKK